MGGYSELKQVAILSSPKIHTLFWVFVYLEKFLDILKTIFFLAEFVDFLTNFWRKFVRKVGKGTKNKKEKEKKCFFVDDKIFHASYSLVKIPLA